MNMLIKILVFALVALFAALSLLPFFMHVSEDDSLVQFEG